VNKFEKPLPDRSVSEDSLLASGEYRRHQSALRKLDEGRRALKAGDFAAAQACAEQAEQDNPGFYRNARLLAESYQGRGRSDEARAAAQRAVAGRPALASERAAIQKLARLGDVGSTNPAAQTNR